MIRNLCIALLLGLSAAVAASTTGCQLASQTSDNAADTESLNAQIAELERELALARANSRALATDVQTQSFENATLTTELNRTRDVLEYAERQFIALEQGLKQKETRASAVATIAEAELRYDRAVQSNPSLLETAHIEEALAKRQLSDHMLNEKRYAASVYFARRASELVELAVSATRPVRIVNVATANMRSGPGMDHDVVARLERGTVLVQLAAESDWYRVDAGGGQAGWVHESVTVVR